MGLPAFIGTALGLSLLNKSNKKKKPAQPLGGLFPLFPPLLIPLGLLHRLRGQI
jgi:hypothetical protein